MASQVNPKFIIRQNGYYACELFVLDADGSHKRVGYAVFDPAGNFLEFFAKKSEAISRVHALATAAISAVANVTPRKNKPK